MKKNARIVADDKENRVEVQIQFKCRNGLLRSEVHRAIKTLARGIAVQLKNVPYSDFGEENTRVEL